MSPHEKKSKKKRGRMPKACIRCRLGKAKCVYSEGNTRCEKCIARDYECVSLIPGQTFEEAVSIYNSRDAKKNSDESNTQKEQAPIEDSNMDGTDDNSLHESGTTESGTTSYEYDDDDDDEVVLEEEVVVAANEEPAHSIPEIPNSAFGFSIDAPFLNSSQPPQTHRMSFAEASAAAAAEAASAGSDIFNTDREISPQPIRSAPVVASMYTDQDYPQEIQVSHTQLRSAPPISTAFGSHNQDISDEFHMPSDWMHLNYQQQHHHQQQQQQHHHQQQMFHNLNNTENHFMSNVPIELPEQFRFSQHQQQDDQQQQDFQSVYGTPASSFAQLSSPVYDGSHENYGMRSASNSISLNMSPQSIVSIQSSMSSHSLASQGSTSNLNQLITPNLGAYGVDPHDMTSSGSSVGSQHSGLLPYLMNSDVTDPESNGDNEMICANTGYTYTDQEQNLESIQPRPKMHRNVRNLEIDIGRAPMLNRYPIFNEQSPTTPTPSASFVAMNADSSQQGKQPNQLPNQHPSNTHHQHHQHHPQLNPDGTMRYTRTDVYEELPEEELYPYNDNRFFF